MHYLSKDDQVFLTQVDNHARGRSKINSRFGYDFYLSLLADLQKVAFPGLIVVAAIVAGEFGLTADARSEPRSFFLAAGLLGAVVFSAISAYFNLNWGHAKQPQVLAAVIALTASFAILTGFIYFLIPQQFLWKWLGQWYCLSLFMAVVLRSSLALLAKTSAGAEGVAPNVAVYGPAALAERIARLIRTQENSDVEIYVERQGFASARDRTIDALINGVQTGKYSRVVLGCHTNDVSCIRDVLAALQNLSVEVQLCLDAAPLSGVFGEPHDSDGLLLLAVQTPPLAPREQLMKAAMDYGLGVIALILAAPVMLLIAVAIKLDSGGPIFFVQSRHGYNQRIVRVIKFRTMTVAEDGAVVVQAVRGDRRVTRVGRILRRTSLDELPQIFNVLRGELSLVGPRPHALAHNEAYSQQIACYAERHKMKPGMTGWAQVNGCRGETRTIEDMRKRVEFDLHYIKNWSIWLDLKILAKTIKVPFSSTNAY